MKVILYTDGAARGNPEGPGGYGAILEYIDTKGQLHTKEMSQGYVKTTNNRMELMAVIEGLKAIRWEHARVEVWSDSKYVVDALQKGWLEGWIAKGWKKVKNPDLWQEFLPLYRAHDVTFHWIKGHAGHPENERCDRLAVAAYSLGAEALPQDNGYIGEDQTLL